MKKSEWQKIVRTMVMEFYPKGGYKTTEPVDVTEETPKVKKELPEELSKKLKEIYQKHKDAIKEDVNEVDFATQIRGVFYEYAQGVENVTPVTQDPVRNPDAVEQQGKDMKDIGQAVEDVGKKAKDIKNKNAAQAKATTTSTIAEEDTKPKCKKCHDTGNYFVKNDYADPSSRNTKTHKGKTGKWVRCPYCDPRRKLKEFVETEILPDVIEIIKQEERPRATKRELLEFFKPHKK